jgi:DNA polymerase-3 subunit delta
LLTAIANQVRRLLSVKGFVQSPQGAVWQKGAAYNYFQRQVMPAVIEYDRFLAESVQRWEERLSPEQTAAKKGAKKKAAGTDLAIVKNPRSPFPVYNAFKKSDNFTLGELKLAHRAVADADMLLKSTAQNPKRVLENVLFKICGSRPQGVLRD